MDFSRLEQWKTIYENIGFSFVNSPFKTKVQYFHYLE